MDALALLPCEPLPSTAKGLAPPLDSSIILALVGVFKAEPISGVEYLKFPPASAVT
jgi:hypothetical protein